MRKAISTDVRSQCEKSFGAETLKSVNKKYSFPKHVWGREEKQKSNQREFQETSETLKQYALTDSCMIY